MSDLSKLVRKAFGALYEAAMSYRRGFVWVLSFAVAMIALGLYALGSFNRLELLTLDWRFNMRPVLHKPSDIVFIDMAEDSVNAIGRWPWPRKWHAALVKILSEYRPRAIAFDVIFSEPQDDVDDTAMEDALAVSGAVYMPVLYDLVPDKVRNYYRGEGVGTKYEPIDRFKGLVRGVGHINAIPDSDGILRRVPAVISYHGKATNHFGVKVAADILGAKEEDMAFDPAAHTLTIRAPGAKTRAVPLDRDNQIIVNWVGPWGRDFRHYSYIDIIKSYARMKEGKKPVVDLEDLRGKICVVGLTAAGLVDIKPIPLSSAYPAVGTNAMVINSVLRGDFIRPASEKVNLFLILLISVVFTFYQCWLRFLGGMVLAITGMIAYAAVSVAVFAWFKIAVTTFYPIFGIFLSYVMTASYTHIMQSVERARLFSQATRDGLTHLYNIRHFSLLMEAEFRNASAFKFRPLSIIMADIDNFKQANDTFGHQAGDSILREMAQVIQSRCRQVDVVARYGGEEFIVMLSGAKAKDAADVAEKIRAAVEARKFRFGDSSYNTTISLGVAEYSEDRTKEDLIARADRALYNAKRSGRNRVCVE
jgi:diguanylate cyclase (GGDEF)-like protein